MPEPQAAGSGLWGSRSPDRESWPATFMLDGVWIVVQVGPPTPLETFALLSAVKAAKAALVGYRTGEGRNDEAARFVQRAFDRLTAAVAPLWRHAEPGVEARLVWRPVDLQKPREAQCFSFERKLDVLGQIIRAWQEGPPVTAPAIGESR